MATIIIPGPVQQAPVKHKLAPALCLDLDGTVRRSKKDPKGFIQGPDDIELMPGIEARIFDYKQKGFLVFGVSNQGGVAHGFKTPADVDREIVAMLELFTIAKPFDIVKTCFHMEGGTVEPFCHRSLFRKPDTGMLAFCELEAFNHGFIVDWDNSLFVGDRDEDRACAEKAGIDFMHIDDFLKPLPASAPAPALPVTLDDAVTYLLPKFRDARSWPEFNQSEDAFLGMCGSILTGGIAMKIRNELKLWEQDSPLHQHFLSEHNLFNADDMSALILRRIYRTLKQEA
ncbi:DUF6794 domain-containing protein [Arsenicibacter rosenii]|uniref:DUF6794 domain-containing protein n=1 Tax=Arsenicibacter rosenii TaxID=1750698 RepID=A0A1S2VAM6_9BACT|nr:DUF6794 domain-containing protein [Arsenicibacter rosenii]OIN55742.1 hypothetical protein BLX24_28415 [Arsenicibacter rosenii]